MYVFFDKKHVLLTFYQKNTITLFYRYLQLNKNGIMAKSLIIGLKELLKNGKGSKF